MSKSMKEVLGQIKGTGKENEVLTEKKGFSASAFDSYVNAIVNDRSYEFVTVDKKGNETKMNISDMIRGDLKKTIKDAGCPQPSELGVCDTCDITTKGLANAIRPIVTGFLATGKKFPLTPQATFGADIFLAPLPGTTKTIDTIDNMTDRNKTGTCTTITEDSVRVKVKSPVPKHLVKKVRKDLNGKVID